MQPRRGRWRKRGGCDNLWARMQRVAYFLCGLLLAAPLAGRAQTLYSVRDLGTLGGSTSAGNALNAAGQVVGNAAIAEDTATNGFLSGANGALPLQNLGTLGGLESFAQGINSSGQVVGSSILADGISYRAFWRPATGGALVNLGTLGGSQSYAYGVNGAGEVAGYSFLSGNGVARAFLSAPGGGALRALGTLPGGTSSYGVGVNASGQVTGYSGTTSGFNHAFLSEASGGALRDLGTLGGRYSFGMAVNNAGQVTGRSELASVGQHAFRSAPEGGPLLDLGTLGGFSSYGLGINRDGAVVGYSYLSDNSTTQAFLYTTAEGMVNLNSRLAPGSGWVLQEARAINDAGQITGVGKIAGATRAFLLTPLIAELRITAITRLTNGWIVVEGRGGPNQVYGVEAAARPLGPWTRRGDLQANGEGVLLFEDQAASAFAQRFYRLVSP